MGNYKIEKEPPEFVKDYQLYYGGVDPFDYKKLSRWQRFWRRFGFYKRLYSNSCFFITKIDYENNNKGLQSEQ